MTVEYAIGDIFTCNACGSHRIKEVLIEALVTTEVVSIDKFGCMRYAKPNIRDGVVDSLRCVECGRSVDRDKLLESVGCTDSLSQSSSAHPGG